MTTRPFLRFSRKDRSLIALKDNLSLLAEGRPNLTVAESDWALPLSVLPVAADAARRGVSVKVDEASLEPTLFSYLRTVKFPDGVSSSVGLPEGTYLPIVRVPLAEGHQRLTEEVDNYGDLLIHNYLG